MPTKPLADLKTLIGTSRCTVEDFGIEAGKVAEFARAITDPNPVFFDEQTAHERGHDRIPVPLTFTRVGTFPRYRPVGIDGHGFDLGFKPEYVLHGGQSYEYERVVRVGDVLSGTTTLIDCYQREGKRAGAMTFAVFETVYTDQDGECVLTERATSIETTGAIDDAEDQSIPTDPVSADPEPITMEPRSIPVREGVSEHIDADGSLAGTGHSSVARDPTRLAVGDTGPTVVVEDVERRDFVRYAGASGDFNPIHYNEPYARAAGNERVFGQGMFTAGIVTRVLTDWFGIGRVASFGVRFRSRVFPGNTIVASGEIVGLEADEAAVELEATARDETLLTGTATVVFD